ncbi:MAG: lipopolysaccharide biosynthesis protein [Methylobacter sp.]
MSEQSLHDACSGLAPLLFLVPLGMLFIYLNHRSDKVLFRKMLFGIVPIVLLAGTARESVLLAVDRYGGGRVGQDLQNGCANMALFMVILAGFLLLHNLRAFRFNRSNPKAQNAGIQATPAESADPYSQQNLRKGALHYLMGRGAAGMAGFLTVLLLVRYMDVSNYAAYTSLSGVVSICGMLSSLGLERAVSLYVPEGRLYRPAKELSRFIWTISAIRFFTVLLVTLLLYVVWTEVNQLISVAEFKFFSVALACFIVGEAMFEHFSSVLQALVMQKTLTRLLIIQWAGRLVLIIGMVAAKASIDWDEALWIFAIPELLGVLGFVVVLNLYLRTLSDPEHIKPVHGGWPSWRKVAEIGLHNYGFTLLATPPQGYFMKILAAVYLSEEVVAAYGFCVSLAERVRRYIPLHFFYNMLEPVIMASYLKNNNFNELSDRCQLLYKSNLLLMVPLIAWVAVAGHTIIGLLTGGKYQDLSWILVLVLVQLTVGSHVVLLQLILNSLGKSRALFSASLFALPVMVITVKVALVADPLGLLLGPLLFSITMNLYIVLHLARSNLVYKPSWKMWWSLVISGAASFLLTLLLTKQAQAWQPGAIVMASASLAAVMLAYSLALWLMKAIRRSEILLVKSFITGS